MIKRGSEWWLKENLSVLNMVYDEEFSVANDYYPYFVNLVGQPTKDPKKPRRRFGDAVSPSVAQR